MLVVFVSGCIIPNNNENGEDDENKTCEPAWLCLDDFNIGYKGEDCVFRNVSFCRKGCYYDRCIDRPDLEVIEIKSPTNISAGQKVKFFSIIQNTGSVPVLAELPCEAGDKKTSFNTRWYVDGRQMAYWCHNTILPGQVNTNYMTWTAQEGTHNITIVVDGADFVDETDENNNQLSVIVEVE